MASPFKVEHKGSFRRTFKFLQKLANGDFYKVLDKYGKLGVEELRDHTPVDTGLAADSWYYEVSVGAEQATITFCNSDIESNRNVIILLEYGHATKDGGWVDGIDIVDPALEPVFKRMIDAVWKEVER